MPPKPNNMNYQIPFEYTSTPCERDVNRRFCDVCRTDVPVYNNGACGDQECCGPNLDYCDCCGESMWT